MNITAEEKLMYEVMKAVYESGIPVNFKGSMVLKACLLEAGYTEDTRHTVDIDANWFSDTPPTGEQLTASLQRAITDSGIDLIVHLFRMYGEGRSAGFELADRNTGEIIFTKEVDEGALNFRMPSMILQPLVENAVNHGIRDMIGEGWIRLTIQNDPDRVKIVIEDNGKGMDALQIQKIMERVETIHEDDSTGIGLDNVISRLSLYYDDVNVVEIVSPGENQGTKVILRLPKKET